MIILEKIRTFLMITKGLRALAKEKFKSINDLDSSCIKTNSRLY